MDALTSVHLKNGPPSLSLALCSLLANRAFLETWSCSKRAPSLNIWPSLNIEPTHSQISEETLESLKLRERNSRASNSTQSQPRNNQKGNPRVTSRDKDTQDSLEPHRSSQQKQVSNKISIKWLNRVVFISKSKDNRVLLLMIDTGKIVYSKTVLYFNHSQLQQFIACVYVFCFVI